MMRHLKKLLLLFLSFNILSTDILRAGFDDTGAGGRAPGMAQTYTAVADDADALYYNPAGLPYITEGQLSTQYGNVLKGTDDGSSNTDTYLGYAQPLNKRKDAIGFGYHMFDVNSLFKERTLTLSYGRRMLESLFGWNGLWSFGLNLKQLHRQFQPDRFTENALNDGVATGQTDPLFAKNGYTTDAYAFDAGLLYRTGTANRHSFGLMMMNANQPDISLAGDGDKVARITKLGYAYNRKWGLLSAEVRRAERLADSADIDFAFGGERRFTLSQGDSAFIMRGGYAQGSRQYKEMTAGASYEFGRLRLDYAFGFPISNTSSTAGTHRLGFSFKFAQVKDKSGQDVEQKSVPQKPAVKAPLSSEVPEAPAVLVAPQPYGVETTPARNEQTIFDENVRNFGILLGNYLRRKGEGAEPAELKALLNQIKTLYGDKGIDMSLIDSQLAEISAKEAATPAATPTPKPETTPILRVPTVVPTPTPVPVKSVQPKTATPVVVPAKVVAPKAVVPPAPKKVKPVSVKHFETMSSLSKMAAMSTELSQAMKYYRMAVDRGISDNERIEVLEAILMRFGEDGAKTVNSELERLRQRVHKNGR